MSDKQRIDSPDVIAERNRRLVDWTADALTFVDKERVQLAAEMALLFEHATDHELAEYLWEKLSAKKVLTDVWEAKALIRRLHEEACRAASGKESGA